jgi:hypothetical protein
MGKPRIARIITNVTAQSGINSRGKTISATWIIIKAAPA